MQPLIVYFPDSSEWLSRAVPKSNRKEFVHKVQEMFDLLSGPVFLICGQNKVESGEKEKEKFVSFTISSLPILMFGRRGWGGGVDIVCLLNLFTIFPFI